MLKKRIIPIVLLDGFSVLKTIKFSTRRNLGSPITVMRTYNTRNIDEMIILDIDASKQNRSVDKFIINDITRDCFMPLTVGGGIKSLNDIEALLKNGADKVSINTFALKNKNFIYEASREFGSQCIVVSLDICKVDSEYYIFSNGKIIDDIFYLDLINQFTDLGAGELLINDVENDGVMQGPDIKLAKTISNISSIPIIFSGGVSSPEDVLPLTRDAKVDAVGISSIFHFTDFTPEDCRRKLREENIPAR